MVVFSKPDIRKDYDYLPDGTNPALKKIWDDEDGRLIYNSRITEEDLRRWRTAGKKNPTPRSAPLPTAKMDIEIVDIKTHYINLSREEEYQPDVLRADGSGSVPALHVYGRLQDGRSICAIVWNYYPYFYVLGQRNDYGDVLKNAAAGQLHETLDQLLDDRRKYSHADFVRETHNDPMDVDEGNAFHRQRRRSSSKRSDPGPTVMSVEPMKFKKATDPYEEMHTFYKVSIRTPNWVTPAREFIRGNPEKGVPVMDGEVNLCGYKFSRVTYESNISFENRFMLDHDIVGAGWAHVDMTGASRRDKINRVTQCDVEIDIDYSAIRGYSFAENPEVFNRVSTRRYLSYDLECATVPGRFPTADKDPVIQAGAVWWTADNPTPHPLMFMVGSCAPIRGVRTICYKTTPEMFEGFAKFIRNFDPDLITGYNTTGFDNPYMIGNVLHDAGFDMNFSRWELPDHINRLLYIGRSRGTPVLCRERDQKSRNKGNRKFFEVQVEGRIMDDMLTFVQQNRKFGSYTLNYVASQVLGDQKLDMSYDMILPFHMAGPEERAKLAKYCVKDAMLPKLLADKLKAIEQSVEFARATGVQLRQIQGQGSSIKVMTCVLRALKPLGKLMPFLPDQEKKDYQGALVAVPIGGFYPEPVVTLDFSSLYPSIMMGRNLSPDTLIPKEDAEKILALKPGETFHGLTTDDIKQCPAGHWYIKGSVRRGFLNQVLDGLLATRSLNKKRMANAFDAGNKELGELFNFRQLAVKEVANSVYGWCGLEKNSVYFWQIAESTTAYGREQITETKEKIESHFTIANGYPGNAKCIYGDTDSVMVVFGVKIEGPAITLCKPCHGTGKIEVTDDCPAPQGAKVTDTFRGTRSYQCKNCVRGVHYTKACIDAMRKTIELSVEAGKLCTSMYAKPNKLEHENCYRNYLLRKDAKKRYAGEFWELVPRKEPNLDYPKDSVWHWNDCPTAPSKFKVQGFESKRRDYAPIAAELQARILEHIVYRNDKEAALKDIQDTIRRVRLGKADIGELIITNRLNARQNHDSTAETRAYKAKHGGGKKGNAAYKAYCEERGMYVAQKSHAAVDDLMRERTGKGYNLNDRIPYMYVERSSGLKKSEDLKWMHAEDPIYAHMHGLQPYLESYIKDIIACTGHIMALLCEDDLEAKARHGSVTTVKRPREGRDILDLRPSKKAAEAGPEEPKPTGSRYGNIASFFQGAPQKDPVTIKARVRRPVRARAAPKKQKYGWRTKEMLLSGDHMRTIRHRKVQYDVKGSGKGLGGHVVVGNRCISCKSRTTEKEFICAQCRPRATEIATDYLRNYDRVQKRVETFWRQCHVCQIQTDADFLDPEVVARQMQDLTLVPGKEDEGMAECNAVQCVNFFRRTTSLIERRELQEAAEGLRSLTD